MILVGCKLCYSWEASCTTHGKQVVLLMGCKLCYSWDASCVTHGMEVVLLMGWKCVLQFSQIVNIKQRSLTDYIAQSQVFTNKIPQSTPLSLNSRTREVPSK